jgi:integrase
LGAYGSIRRAGAAWDAHGPEPVARRRTRGAENARQVFFVNRTPITPSDNGFAPAVLLYLCVHLKAKEALDLWLERSCLASTSSAPLFSSFGKNRETLNWRHLDRRSVLKLVEKRARTSGILKRVCCHSFRATGVTEYMNLGGTIEIAQRIAGHTSPSTTRIYDRSGDQLTLQEIERVQIGKKQEICILETSRHPGA